MHVRRERLRLDRVFGAILLAVGGPTIAVACDDSTDPKSPSEDAGAHDATQDASSNEQDGAKDASSDASVVDAAHDAATDARLDAPHPLFGGDAAVCVAGEYAVDSGVDAGPDADEICAYTFTCGVLQPGLINVGCDVYDMALDGAAVLGSLSCHLVPGQGCEADAFAPLDGGAYTIECSPCPGGGGRRPAGLLGARRTARGGTALGAYLASMAYEEEASIFAFERMRAELEALGAPRELIGASKRAARDEARHAHVMTKLARARRGSVAKPRVRRARSRSAAAIASENAAEGCIRETYGALLARWQSIHAEDAEVRRAFARIAEDETRHAALAWTLARWLEPRLATAREKHAVANARARAIAKLARSLDAEPCPLIARGAGLPSATEARALLQSMLRALNGTLDPRAKKTQSSLE